MALTLFNNITEDLTKHEKEKIVPAMLHIFEFTNENARVTNTQIRKYLVNFGFNTSDVRVRKMVNYIRQLNLCSPAVLIGASNGYFITKIITVVDAQIESMQGRVDSQAAVIDAMKAQRENLKRQYQKQ